MDTTDVPLSPTHETTDTDTTTEPIVTTARTLRTPFLIIDGRKFMLGVCLISILLGVFIQIHSFPKVKWEKMANVDWSIPFGVGFGFVFDGTAVAFFGRPYWPAAIKFLSFVFSFVIVNFLGGLSAWWDRLTMILMLVGMVVEYVRYRLRRR